MTTLPDQARQATYALDDVVREELLTRPIDLTKPPTKYTQPLGQNPFEQTASQW